MWALDQHSWEFKLKLKARVRMRTGWGERERDLGLLILAVQPSWKEMSFYFLPHYVIHLHRHSPVEIAQLPDSSKYLGPLVSPSLAQWQSFCQLAGLVCLISSAILNQQQNRSMVMHAIQRNKCNYCKQQNNRLLFLIPFLLLSYIHSKLVIDGPQVQYNNSLIIIHLKSEIMKLLLLVLLSTFILSLQASSIKTSVSLAVTIYNDQFAMVKDVRSISFDQGRSDLYFTDVSSNIQAETVTFKALQNSEDIRVFEQNYEANLVNTNAILEKYINEEVEIYTRLGEKSYKLNGTLLGYNSGYILKTSSGIQVLNNIEGVHFPSLPEGFFTLPTLGWKVFSNQTVTTDCEVAYRTTGFSWKSDYSVTLSEDQTRADIGGWVSIDNHSGKRYLNAKLKLIAGDVNTVQNNQYPQPVMYMAKTSAPMMADSAPSFSEKSFSDYHMYTLSEPVSLNDNSQKQVEFIPRVYNITVRKYNLLTINSGGYSQTNLKASNKVQFRNSKSNGLGIPFPKGTVRVFKADETDGSLEFVGEDSIGHTPKDQNITINTGNAFDITANKYATNYQSFNNNGGYSADLNLTVYNHKSISAEIVVELTTYGNNLKINWKTQGLDIEKVSASLLRIKRVFKADQKFVYEWSEDYRP